jgi:large subunit ribosomal protein L28
MAKCDLCGKAPSFGNNVSHANNKSRKMWKPNVQRVKAVVGNGTVRHIRACTACLKSGRVVKAA